MDCATAGALALHDLAVVRHPSMDSIVDAEMLFGSVDLLTRHGLAPRGLGVRER
jgi:hypothetical protein